MWTLQFALLSGQEVTVQAEPEETIDNVLNKAQEALNVLIVSVVSYLVLFWTSPGPLRMKAYKMEIDYFVWWTDQILPVNGTARASSSLHCERTEVWWCGVAAPVVRCQIIFEMSRRCVPTPVPSLPSPRER